MAVKWRELLRFVEQEEMINPGLFGGRPGCEAQSQVFAENLLYDISTIIRRILLGLGSDATSCFDRIICALASVVLRKHGMHRAVVFLWSNTSSNFYSHDPLFPIFGTGQGSGNSPSIWLQISSILYDLQLRLAHGATFVTADEQEQIKLSMMGFFDDITGFVNHFAPQEDSTLDDLTSKMKEDAQIWTDLLWCSGGKLELPKCTFFALRFMFPPDGSAKPIRQAPPTTMTVVDREDGSEVEIPTIRADESHKLLGHFLSPVSPPRGKLPEGETPKQLDALLDKALTTVSLIAASPLTRYGTTLVYHGVYLTQLGYVLPQCSFSAKELNRTEAKTLSNVISKMGYNCHTPRALRYAPTSLAGCGLVSWYTLQGTGQILLFLKHWQTNTMVSRILRCALSWCQWQSGLSQPLLTDTRTKIPHVSAKWIPSLRAFLRKIDGTIELTHSYTVPPEREGDTHIMDYAIRSKVFDDDALRLLNYCRQYLVITTISEMFDEKGERLLPHIFATTAECLSDEIQVEAFLPRIGL